MCHENINACIIINENNYKYGKVIKKKKKTIQCGEKYGDPNQELIQEKQREQPEQCCRYMDHKSMELDLDKF